MPSFISKGGEWHPAQEKTVVNPAESKSNPQPGAEPFIHNGPDREAVEFIAKENGISPEEAVESKATIGTLAVDDPQILEVARQHGLTVEQWMEKHKPTPKQVALKEEADKKVVTHNQKKTKKDAQGGKGGFFNESSDPVKEFNSKS